MVFFLIMTANPGPWYSIVFKNTEGTDTERDAYRPQIIFGDYAFERQ
jgi:hypothetical protein